MVLTEGPHIDSVSADQVIFYLFFLSQKWLKLYCKAFYFTYKIYLLSSASQYSAISFWLSGSDHQITVNLNSLINCKEKKIDFSCSCLNQKEQRNFSELLPSAYSLDIFESIKGQIFLPNANSNIKELISDYINWKGYQP